MNIDTCEWQEELHHLRAKLEVAEASRLAGVPTYTLEQVFDGLEDIYRDDKTL